MDDTADAVRAYRAYFDAFQTLDAAAVLPYYHLPCLVATSDAVFTITSDAEARTMFGAMMENLRARGYGRSECPRLGVHALGANQAVFSASVIRWRADGVELERFGATYTMRRTDAGWKIVTLTIHDPRTVLPLPEPPV